MTEARNRYYLANRDIDRLAEREHRHQFNSNAVRRSRPLSRLLGMEQIGVHLVRLEPGLDSTQYHWHSADEEFLYILSGQGEARVGDDVFLCSAGDFFGFPADGVAHALHNNGETDLVYLMGGTRHPHDAVHYPDIRRTMYKSPGRRTWADWDDLHDLSDHPDLSDPTGTR